MRISADGFIHVRQGVKVRTPGRNNREIEPVEEDQALAFLLSHTFLGHRKIVRGLNSSERRKLRLALWADSVNDRMDMVVRVWRAITVPVAPPRNPTKPKLIQVVTLGKRHYPIYLDGEITRVIPEGGVPDPLLLPNSKVEWLDLAAKPETRASA